ncbi:MAG: GumC family protein [Dictyoglomus sp.]|nr:GumC family protein [Dictyoglomus sp.]MDW8188146.1 GumC family protein [Dictyoglomus sp.]
MKEDIGTEEISLVELFHIIWRRKNLIIALFIISVILALVYSLLSPKIYSASSVILIPSEKGTSGLSSLISSLPVNIGILGITTPAANYVAILKSRSAAEYVFDKLKLDNYFEHKFREEKIEALRKIVKITQNEKENTITITAEAKDPKLSADIANAYVEALEKIIASLNISSAKRERMFIEEQLKRVERDLKIAEEKLKNFQERHLLIDVSSEAKVLIDNLANLYSQRESCDMSIKLAKRNLEDLQNILIEQTNLQRKDILAITSLTYTSSLNEWREKLISQEVDLALLSLEYGPEHPKVVAAKAAVDMTKKVMKDEIERISKAIGNYSLDKLFSLQLEIVFNEAKKKALDSVIEKYEKKLSQLPSLGLELGRLMREVKVQETIYTLLTSQYEQAKVNEAKENIVVQVVDYAVPPVKKSKPSTTLNVLIAGVSSIFLGIFLAFFLNFWGNFREELRKLEEK